MVRQLEAAGGAGTLMGEEKAVWESFLRYVDCLGPVVGPHSEVAMAAALLVVATRSNAQPMPGDGMKD